jgi:hypothetical protein
MDLLRERLKQVTTDEANMGGDFEGQLLVDLYGSTTWSFAGEHGLGELDDALRVASALNPLHDVDNLSYRWVAVCEDEGFSFVAFLAQDGPTAYGASRGRYAEVPISQLRAFPGGDIVDAVVFVARIAQEALSGR